MNQNEPPPPSPAPWPALLAWILGGVALLPVIVLHDAFARLFWFGDEWDLLEQIWRVGFWSWTWQAFAENFVPLFKLLWYGLVVAGNGDYRVMIAALWLTHAVNVALFGLLLRESGFGRVTASGCMLVFGLTPTNLETLGWSVQWSAVLATTFFLWAGWWQMRHFSTDHRWHWRNHLVLFALSAASALCFSRGVLTGAALAVIALWPVSRNWLHQAAPRLRTAAVCLAPGIAVAALIYLTQPGGNHRQLGGADRLLQMLEYAGWYFGMNPLHRLLHIDAWGWRTTTLIAALKLALIGWCLWRSSGLTRRALALLLVWDLGNALLLGLGRYHTGLETAHSSRYQYSSLLATLPFAAWWIDERVAKLTSSGWRFLRPALGAALLLGVTLFVVRDWRSEADGFTQHRGHYTRHLLFHDPNPPAMGAVPGIGYLSTQRAKELIRRYNLH
ncbi:MAG TPA: hypothetical protein VHF69_04245 [Candidatus Synoicihabitans sp.]|nr:hypothetical protein [Candidatus Synoicihabitans sp.]